MGKRSPQVDAYIAKAAPFAQPILEKIRDAFHAASPDIEEVIKWGNVVYLANGPVFMIRAEDERVLLGFWRGARLRTLEPRLKPGGKYEMATLELREGMIVKPATVRRLTRNAVVLDRTLGDPRLAAKPGAKRRSKRR